MSLSSAELKLLYSISDLEIFSKLSCLFRFLLFIATTLGWFLNFLLILRTVSSNWFELTGRSSHWCISKLDTTLPNKLFRRDRAGSCDAFELQRLKIYFLNSNLKILLKLNCLFGFLSFIAIMLGWFFKFFVKFENRIFMLVQIHWLIFILGYIQTISNIGQEIVWNR